MNPCTPSSSPRLVPRAPVRDALAGRCMRLAAAATLLALLGACGGGGGGSTNTTPPPQTALTWDSGNWDSLNWN